MFFFFPVTPQAYDEKEQRKISVPQSHMALAGRNVITEKQTRVFLKEAAYSVQTGSGRIATERLLAARVTQSKSG